MDELPPAHAHRQPLDAVAVPGRTPNDLIALRALLPNLQAMSDQFMASADTAMLIQLNAAAAPIQQHQPFDYATAAAHAAAAAQHVPGQAPTDPSVRMAKNLENMKGNPIVILEGRDDRITTLHPARFLGGTVCGTKKLWRTARDHIPLEGIEPLATYDFSIGLGGCITPRGIMELHNPASQNLSLKMFTSANMTSSSISRRLTLVDGDSAVSVGDNLKDIINLESFIHAMRALCEAAHFICPWNFSFTALNGFLISSNYAARDLAGNRDRVAVLVDFVNHVFKLNANSWIQREDFLSSGELKNTWDEFFANQPAHLLTAAATAQPATQFQSTPQRYRRGSGRSGYSANRNQNQNQAVPAVPNLSVPPPAAPPTQLPVCRNFNSNACLNQWDRSFLASGTRALHVCYVAIGQGQLCRQNHSRPNHPRRN
jgi:hypothetical protein